MLNIMPTDVPNLEPEIHPFAPFLPHDATILIMGTFPPPMARWSMNFYYPNRTNDFWYMMGLIFFGSRTALLVPETKNFDLDKIKKLLIDKGIAMSDTGYKVRRLRGNASDKFLEILEPVDIESLLRQIPKCTVIATTGEKAAETAARILNVETPKIGAPVVTHDGRYTLWRLPSTSRAYPLKLELKAAAYQQMFDSAHKIS